ncbi:hypothetical protein BH24CHL5_BH24CHL5_11590 [soil metagenome]
MARAPISEERYPAVAAELLEYLLEPARGRPEQVRPFMIEAPREVVVP